MVNHAGDEYLAALGKPLYVSVQYGPTVLGSFILCLGFLSMMQHGPAALHSTHPNSHHKRPRMFYHRISMFYRIGLGTALLLLTLLDIGPFWSFKEQEQVGPVAPIYRLIDSSAYLPFLFLVTLTAALVDFVSWFAHMEPYHPGFADNVNTFRSFSCGD